MSVFRKITGILLSLTIAVCSCTFCIAASAESTVLPNGKSTIVKLSAGNATDYTFTVGEDSEMTFDLLSKAPWSSLSVVEKSSKEVMIPDIEARHGAAWYDEKLKFTRVYWDSDNEPINFQGTFTYYLKKGSYTLTLKSLSPKESLTSEEYENFKKEGNQDYYEASYTFTAKYISAAALSYFVIPMKKGTTLTLGTVISGDTTETVKWSSSKSSVAAVSKKGKITAKAKGSAIITAKLGTSTIKIKIKVTS